MKIERNKAQLYDNQTASLYIRIKKDYSNNEQDELFYMKEILESLMFIIQ